MEAKGISTVCGRHVCGKRVCVCSGVALKVEPYEYATKPHAVYEDVSPAIEPYHIIHCILNAIPMTATMILPAVGMRGRCAKPQQTVPPIEKKMQEVSCYAEARLKEGKIFYLLSDLLGEECWEAEAACPVYNSHACGATPAAPL